MKLLRLIRRYLVWMILSYAFIIGIVYAFVLIPQRQAMETSRQDKARIEYDYMRMTGSPSFIQSMENTLTEAGVKTRNFHWVDSGEVDASLTFYNYIAEKAAQSGLVLLEVTQVESRGTRRTDRDRIYHNWRAGFAGGFNDMLELLKSVETDERFMIIEEISILPSRRGDTDTVYTVSFLAIKRDAAL